MTQATLRTDSTKQRILFVEDDPSLCAFLGRYFGEEGYQVDMCYDGVGLRRLLAQTRFDLVVMDVGLPGRDDGYALAREIRGQHKGGLLFLSGRQEAIDRIVGLEIGADDFLVKPFEPRELLARVRAILRRLPAEPAAPPRPDHPRMAHFDGWSLDFESRMLRDATGRVQSLTTQEFNLLSALAQRPGRVLSRDQLLDFAANRDWSPFDRSIDVMIGKIRRKIGDTGPEHRVIRTIRGAGYMFSPSG
ncbi:response regulator transcription factor [Paracoccus litorisediminis]|jgi:DNA-binding response OmpR family regulator|uniref:Regulatory protein VirG n=1 Tax=Paracoccus litorisediminis TaxID=2006130 RepID=A0A844HL81_9RHOB|nr:response regulator transcription factor [Paracoccus litorisediminis]MTH61013.1 response regulator [Paracoccus litorisediminis]